ncbi:phosphate ABC transporter substrate-binding protein PstS family protein [Schleiferilactobacillus harbinensis]|uniref:Phosphate-binding protein n=1 Tax=Schleiferilactobacillus harbinensis DSM 16991 TaxID=1122147 RepID=A0A0R1X5A0_9LACO|nr:phosphate ABC transporter substrate-binding protein PstS family protein [Schleiferilactobacillus harbinensis]KRM25463.1 ABC-type phosphate transport system, periplasmic component [Schleiferilactobacillus harbinensis DSM 16991]QFR64591.1 phosphate ABC transporter substrate-binding protein PstS family protein [Schleiferilactobacillus harbinensis]GEK06729.1 phosphate ABC transporter substrate-binding protein [Schleiferilactobacillus harbinensis]
MKKGILISAIALTVAGLLAGCGSQSASTKSSTAKGSTQTSTTSGKIVAVGSTALQPLADAVAKDFQDKNPGVTINVQGGGSGTGLGQIAQGSVDIGNSDIFAEQKGGIDASKVVDHQVAVVGMGPVANKDAGVTNLTMAQLRDIFTGKVTNWKEVGGKDQKITVVNRAEGSGTRATFEASVTDGKAAVKSLEQDSNGTVQKIVATTPGAISYLAFSYFKDDLQALSIDGVKPTDDNVTTNKWKIWSYEHMYTTKKPSSATKAYIKYMQSTAVQDSAVKKLGYISIHNMKVVKYANNKVTDK